MPAKLLNLTRCCLAAGGRWIRTICPAINGRGVLRRARWSDPRGKDNPRDQPPLVRDSCTAYAGHHLAGITALHRVRQQAKKRTEIAAGAVLKNRPNNKLARMSVVMRHLKAIALISCASLNRTVTSQDALIVLKRAFRVEKFYHSRTVKTRIG